LNNVDHTRIIVDSQPPSLEVERLDPIFQAITSWVHSKKRRSGSVRTEHTYAQTLLSFRAHLQVHQMDLDWPRKQIKDYLQGWAASNAGESGATFNQRLAIVSSFYKYAHKNDAFWSWEEVEEIQGGQPVTIRRQVALDNPADYVERADVKPYARAKALRPPEVEERLSTIDTSTIVGLRDYALLAVSFTTGWRLAELAALQRQDMQIGKKTPEGEEKAREVVTLVWRRAKGNKTLADDLEPEVRMALVRYLQAVFDPDWQQERAEAPVWLALDSARTATSGRQQTMRRSDAPLGVRAISYLCQRHLGTGKVHVIRHSLALAMMKAGGPVQVIQERQAYESLETTAEYLPQLERAENPFAPKVAASFGLGRKESAHARRRL
jgi:site-specific recombinase XerD